MRHVLSKGRNFIVFVREFEIIDSFDEGKENKIKVREFVLVYFKEVLNDLYKKRIIISMQ